ncbi:DUF2712 domain-containing protein [Lacticaseibacillus mingshuiensis]|uniref:DUF2712 domain-containing protein n=1 Tax=Lacticaseibacillus mingshuiensis TaxID=2799574 RepID=A0ABW4CIV6_9LACO|nr:DUF2712 domain-containing protein [Lacticaseibacillus mingshuiensis]
MIFGALFAGAIAIQEVATPVSAFTDYTIGVPATTKTAKPNSKDLNNPEMVSNPARSFAVCVLMTTEGSGKGTITTLWMEYQNATINTSYGANDKQSNEIEYQLRAHKNQGLIKGTWHNVTAENNNYSAKAFVAKGWWSADNSK